MDRIVRIKVMNSRISKMIYVNIKLVFIMLEFCIILVEVCLVVKVVFVRNVNVKSKNECIKFFMGCF